MKAAIYARDSTANNGQEPTMQTWELREYCDRRGWDVVGEYVDTASGAKDCRPELNQLIADVHRRKCDAVLVWKLDRWWRSLRHLVSSLVGRAWGRFRFRFSVYPAQECASSVLGADFNLLGQLLDLLCLLDDRDRHGGCGVCHFHFLPKHKGQSV